MDHALHNERARRLRNAARLNPDGTESTVLFASGEADGKHLVYPTLFPKDPERYGSDPADWTEIPHRGALDEARKRGELFEFDSAEEADTFAKGSWKTPSFGGGSSSGAGAGSDWGLTDVDIEEMIRNKPTLEDTIRDGPSARPLTLPTMLSPEQTHEAKKDYLKMVGEEAVTGAALGGVGRVGKAALPFLPTKLPQFKKWFSGSKVVDDAGEPLVMYHGTSVPDVEVFETYGSNYGLMGTGSYFTASPKVASGYAETGLKKASRMGSEPSPNVMPVYLNLRNPIDMGATADKDAWIRGLQGSYAGDDAIDAVRTLKQGATNEDALRELESLLMDLELPRHEGAEEIRVLFEKMGHDGLTHIGGGRTGGLKHRVYVAFNPEAVKSATGNRGTFDPFDPRITYGVAGAGLATQEDIESNLDAFKKALGGQ